MNDIEAFINCNGRMAVHRVNLLEYRFGAPNGKPCFTRLDGDLLLCDSCTEFWLLRQGARDIATLEKAVKLRSSHVRHGDKMGARRLNRSLRQGE